MTAATGSEAASLLDMEALLAPIPGMNPAGEDPRESSSATSTWQKIRSARGDARRLERLRDFGEHLEESPLERWRTIAELVPRLLATEAKDLEATVYLTEALLRLHGFAGLTAGFRLLRLLVEEYWDNLYPMPDEDGLETRLAHVYGLNGRDAEGTLIRPILMTELTGGESVEPCSAATWEQARAFDAMSPEEQQKRADETTVTLSQIDTAIAETPAGEFRRIRQQLEECRQEFDAMSAAFAEVCGDGAPHTSGIREALATCGETLTYIVGNRLDAELPSPETAGEASEQDDLPAAGGEPLPAGEVVSRQQALEMIGRVAAWFRRNEPHSPLSFAADQLVRWGNMPLPELLEEAIPDDHARSHFFRLMGIPESNH